MKFLDIINEDEQSEFDKVFKRTNTIFKAYRKGRIRTKSGIVFSYELPEDSHISVSAGRGEEPTGFIICERIKIKQESQECVHQSYGHFGEFIKRKFKNHGIDFIFNVYPEDIEKYKHETINEAIDWQDENSSNLTDDQLKQLKRAKTVYKALKKGKATFNLASSFDEPDEHTVNYELGEPYYYWIYVSGTNTFRIEISKIKVFIDDHKFYERAISKEIIQGGYKTMEWILLHNVIAPRVRKRFGNNDIDIRIADADLIFEYIEPQTINEDFQVDKKLNKAKLIYKTFKRGKMKLGGGGDPSIVYYELVDPTYSIIDEHDNGDIIDKNVYINSKLVTYTDDKLLVQTCSPNNLDEPSLRIKILKLMAKNIVDKFYIGWDIVLSINTSDIEVNHKPKEPQPINEDDNEKLLKKAKTVYKAYKKGKYKSDNEGRRDDALFSYTLSDDPRINVFQYYIDHKTIGTKVGIKCEIFIKCLNEVANWTKTDRMIKNIVNKFKSHDIDIDIQEWTYNMKPYTKPTEPINEDEDKRIKKARTIYKAFKKGLLNKGEHGNVKYELPDEYDIRIRSIDDVIIIELGDEGDDNEVKFYFGPNEDGEYKLTRPGPKYYYTFIERLYQKFFHQYDIKLIC